MLNELLVIGVTLVAAILAATAQYTLKKSVPKFTFGLKGIKSLATNKGIWLGGIIYIAGLVIYLKALDSGQLSFVYPTFASTFVFVVLISHFLLKERIDAKRWVGLALIFLGIAIVALTY